MSVSVMSIVCCHHQLPGCGNVAFRFGLQSDKTLKAWCTFMSVASAENIARTTNDAK